MDKTLPSIKVSKCSSLLKKSASEPISSCEHKPSAIETLKRCSSALVLLQARVDNCTEKVRSLSKSNSPVAALPGLDMADKCQLEHDPACEGGIPETHGQKGRWKACPPEYVYLEDCEDDLEYGDSAKYQDDTDMLNDPENQVGYLNVGSDLLGFTGTPLQMRSTENKNKSELGIFPSSQAISTGTLTTSENAALAVSGASAKTSSVNSLTTPVVSTLEGQDVSGQVAAARSRLDVLKKKRQEIELLVEIEREEQLELDQARQLQQKLSKERRQSNVRPQISEGVSKLRARNQVVEQAHNEDGFYSGPNINQIRKTPGLDLVVENRVSCVLSDIPSLARRPDNGTSNFQQSSKMKYRAAQHTRVDAFDPVQVNRGKSSLCE